MLLLHLSALFFMLIGAVLTQKLKVYLVSNFNAQIF